MSITPAQLKLIHVARRTLGLDEDTYREMLIHVAGVGSATDLDQTGFEKVLKHLRACGFKKIGGRKRLSRPRPGATRPEGKVVSLATAKQIDKINTLAGLIQWRSANGLELWLQKRMGIQRVRTDYDAYLVTEGLKKMFEHQMEAKHGKGWWALEYDDQRIAAYIDEHCPAKYKDLPGIVLRGSTHA